MRRNISANIVSIGSMRIAKVRERKGEVVVKKNGTEVEWFARPFHPSEDDDDRVGRLASFCDSS